MATVEELWLSEIRIEKFLLRRFCGDNSLSPGQICNLNLTWSHNATRKTIKIALGKQYAFHLGVRILLKAAFVMKNDVSKLSYCVNIG